jgi:hypothetical protein
LHQVLIAMIAAVIAVVVQGAGEVRSERGEGDFRHVLIGMAIAAIALGFFLAATKPAGS